MSRQACLNLLPALILLLSTAACNLPDLQQPGTDTKSTDFSKVECVERDEDSQGYLLAICEYIVTNTVNVAPADPAQLNIKEIEERVEDDRRVLYVYLDCCGMGDIAILDA